MAASKAPPDEWEREREPLKQALALELQRVATFFPSCKTVADVKTVLALHRDLHGKSEQSSGPNSVVINLGMLRSTDREKLTKGRVVRS